jgi:hypothetical protein
MVSLKLMSMLIITPTNCSRPIPPFMANLPKKRQQRYSRTTVFSQPAIWICFVFPCCHRSPRRGTRDSHRNLFFNKYYSLGTRLFIIQQFLLDGGDGGNRIGWPDCGALAPVC